MLLSRSVQTSVIVCDFCDGKNRFFSFGATGKKKSIVAATSGVGTIGNMQQLSLACGSSTRRRGSGGERSLSGSPPDHAQTASGSVSTTGTSLLLASSSATTAAASAGINSSAAITPSGGSGATCSSAPSDDCDTPYRYAPLSINDPSIRIRFSIPS